MTADTQFAILKILPQTESDQQTTFTFRDKTKYFRCHHITSNLCDVGVTAPWQTL